MSVDWDAQWASFAPGFKDGVLPLSLKKFKGEKRKGEIFLRPGPGFGDFSHPTTRVTLELMATLVKERPFLDIGCGSGILTLAAIALGASSGIGVDIDPEALLHAEMNRNLNGFQELLRFYLPVDLKLPFYEGVIALNMISSEQEVAWKSLPELGDFKGDLVVSGLLLKEEGDTVKRFTERGWKKGMIKKSKDWMGITFNKD